MSSFKLRRHSVVKAFFSENALIEKKSLELDVEGNILFPKSLMESKQVVVKLKLHLGKEEERLTFLLETVSIFDIEDCQEMEITEAVIQEKCLPVALANMRKTVKEVSVAYGLPAIDLAPFEREYIF